MDKLRNIGFYTLEDSRAKAVNDKAPLWRCELLVTSKCNFNCPYCRGMREEDAGDLSWDDARRILDFWIEDNLQNIRFSGGEPTLWEKLPYLVAYAKKGGIKRIAISTNGSANISLYRTLINAGVNDFSVSLDSCCAATGNQMAGNIPVWEKVVENIKKLSALVYTTIGIVITDSNVNEIDNLVSFASRLGVADIRLITEAQKAKHLPSVSSILKKHPILVYRLTNFKKGRPIRGIGQNDNNFCPLVLDDMAVLNNKHYPCIIYLREQGKHIGIVGPNMREERKQWFLNHNCYKDKICRNNCLDVCVDYNNRVLELNGSITRRCTRIADKARQSGELCRYTY